MAKFTARAAIESFAGGNFVRATIMAAFRKQKENTSPVKVGYSCSIDF
jgi:hypothetical protein